MAFSVQSPPLRWVLHARFDVLEGDGEVNEEEIEVVDAPKLELVLRQLLSLCRVELAGAKSFTAIIHERGHKRGRCSTAWR